MNKLKAALIALTLLAAPVAAVAAPVVAAPGAAPAAVAQARPMPDRAVYCGPGYYPPEQYGGRCVQIKRIQFGVKPPLWKPWRWF